MFLQLLPLNQFSIMTCAYDIVIQVDAHCDLQDTTFGEKITHGTPFRRAIEDGLVSPQHIVQIGLRGGATGQSDIANTYQWGMKQVYCVHLLLNIMLVVKEIVLSDVKKLFGIPGYTYGSS